VNFLASTVCIHCAITLAADEPPRTITQEEVAGRVEQYGNLTVANGRCPKCLALYLLVYQVRPATSATLGTRAPALTPRERQWNTQGDGTYVIDIGPRPGFANDGEPLFAVRNGRRVGWAEFTETERYRERMDAEREAWRRQGKDLDAFLEGENADLIVVCMLIEEILPMVTNPTTAEATAPMLGWTGLAIPPVLREVFGQAPDAFFLVPPGMEAPHVFGVRQVSILPNRWEVWVS
jgi:hypothetical protein